MILIGYCGLFIILLLPVLKTNTPIISKGNVYHYLIFYLIPFYHLISFIIGLAYYLHFKMNTVQLKVYLWIMFLWLFFISSIAYLASGFSEMRL
jgi:hypothetical protein